MIRSWIDKNARGLVFGLLMAVVFLYFVYMTVQGDRGIMSMLRAQNNLQASESDLDATRTAREALEARVKRMRPNSIDPDLLEEQTRHQLNMVRPDEVVILTAPQQETAKKQDLLQRSK